MKSAERAWSTSFPGAVLGTCVLPGSELPDDALRVHHLTGRSLRIGGEIALCFDCGPDGGVYHPDEVDMATVRKKAAELDRRFNRFEVHSHHTFIDGHDGPAIEHSHTDGSEPHKHPETATARFDATPDQLRAYLLMGGGKVKMTAEPNGPQLPFVELSEAEATFRVVISYEYNGHGNWDGEGNALYTRAEWRRSMDLYVAAARNPGVDPIGHGAIPLTTARLMLNFRQTPTYEIAGWMPTGPRWLP